MRVELIIDGKSYMGKEKNYPVSRTDYVEELCESINSFVSFSIQLEDGSFMVIGEEVTKKTIFIVHE